MELLRRLESGALTSLLALPDRAVARVVDELGGPPVTRGVPMDTRASLLIHLDRRLHVPLDRLTPDAARVEADRRVAVSMGPPPDGVQIEAVRLPHPGVQGGLVGLLHRPRVARPGPLVVHFHQGGFVLGRPEWSTTLASVLVGALGARVVAVGYRRAPEHPLPEIQADALAAVRAARAAAPSWGADPRRLVVAGDSAGGHLAAWVAQRLPPEERPAAQLLVYPFLDAAAETRSRTELAHGHPVSDAFLGWARAHAMPFTVDPFDPEVSPGRRESLSGLPPAVIATAGFDPLLDEGDAYAARLASAGVRVRHRRFLDLPHGFTVMAGAVPRAGEALRLLAGDLGVLLRAPRA